MFGRPRSRSPCPTPGPRSELSGRATRSGLPRCRVAGHRARRQRRAPRRRQRGHDVRLLLEGTSRGAARRGHEPEPHAGRVGARAPPTWRWRGHRAHIVERWRAAGASAASAHRRLVRARLLVGCASLAAAVPPSARRSRSTAGRCRCRTSTRCCTPRPGSPRATSSTTTRASRRCCSPHLRGRPLTLKRYPNGVEATYFYEKQCPSHAPDWVQTGADSSGDGINFVLGEDLPTLVWLANLADLELHTSLAHAEWLRQPDRDRVRPRPGPAGDDRRVRRGGARAADDLRAPGHAGVPEDLRVEGDAGLRAAEHADERTA